MKEVEEATESSLLPSCIEVAFAGRSNVGKSSLINALTLSSAAKSANVPGYTQSLHFYAVSALLSPSLSLSLRWVATMNDGGRLALLSTSDPPSPLLCSARSISLSFWNT